MVVSSCPGPGPVTPPSPHAVSTLMHSACSSSQQNPSCTINTSCLCPGRTHHLNQAAHWRHVDLGLPVSHSLWPPGVSVARSLRTVAIECICWTCGFSPVQCRSQQCYVHLRVFDKCLEKLCPRPLSLLILRYSSVPQTLPHCDTNR